MARFWNHVKRVVQDADVIIEVLDARQIDATRNKEVEEKIAAAGKKILYVVTKCDLVELRDVKRQMKFLHPCVFISSTQKHGTTILKKKILEMSRGDEVIVGVVGYPNVGKSSLINALSGRGAARTSSESGFTKGRQRIRVDNKIVILDTPGVYPFKEADESKHAMIGAVDYSKVKDAEGAAIRLLDEHFDLVCRHFEIDALDSEEALEVLGQKIGRLRRGGVVDIDATARFLLKEWQTGKIIVK